MKGMMLISFGVNLIMSGAASYMVGWINSLQMILHLPMLLILVPPNVSSFLSIILPIVQFDILDPSWTTDLIFEFEEEIDEEFENEFKSSVFDQMHDLGYETHNSMRLLGSLFVFMCIYLLRALCYYPAVKWYAKRMKKDDAYSQELGNSLFYGEIITISVESYIELLIAGYLNSKYQLNSTMGERFSVWISFICIAICLFVLPALSVYILTRPV